MTLEPAGSVCLQCHMVDEYCLLCKKEHCRCRGFNEKNHPTEEHKIKGAITGFMLRKKNKKDKREGIIQLTFVMDFDPDKDNLNEKLGSSTVHSGIMGSIWTKNTYPVTAKSVRGKELLANAQKELLGGKLKKKQ